MTEYDDEGFPVVPVVKVNYERYAEHVRKQLADRSMVMPELWNESRNGRQIVDELAPAPTDEVLRKLMDDMAEHSRVMQRRWMDAWERETYEPNHTMGTRPNVDIEANYRLLQHAYVDTKRWPKPPTTDTEEAAWLDGLRAGRAHESIATCPYTENTPQATAWLHGWAGLMHHKEAT